MNIWKEIEHRVITEKHGDCNLIVHPKLNKRCVLVNLKGKMCNVRKSYYEYHVRKLEKDEMLFTSCGHSNCLNLDHIDLKLTRIPKPIKIKKTIEDNIKYNIVDDCHIITSHKSIHQAIKNYYEYVNGEIEKGYRFIHTCNNNDCCNLDHIKIINMNILNKELFEYMVNYEYKNDIKNDCWISDRYPGHSRDYPTVGINNKTISLHRFSYVCHKGEIPKGMIVMHTCDNTLCCNPNHLNIGTLSDNTQDMINKDRACRNGGFRKLSRQDVIDIYLSELSSYDLCKIYPVTSVQVRRIKNKTRWKNVTGSIDR